jgi:hypothetical protein
LRLRQNNYTFSDLNITSHDGLLRESTVPLEIASTLAELV